MKKITLLLLLFVGSIYAQNENYYTLSARTETYADLQNPISINNGQVWNDYSELGPVTIPFELNLFGNTFSEFFFTGSGFTIYLQSGFNIKIGILAPFPASYEDLGGLTGVSLSPISYKIDGEAGNRILKFEVKNAGLVREDETLPVLENYVNFQIWVYESDQSIEYHFGATNVINPLYFNSDGLLLSILLFQDMTFSQDFDIVDLSLSAGYVYGEVANPDYEEFTINGLEGEEPDPLGSLDGIPQSGQVYKFTPGPLNNSEFEKAQFVMYPNPTTDFIHVDLKEVMNESYAIYDVKGKQILSGKVNHAQTLSIDVQSLTSGNYLLKVGKVMKMFVKK